jgi:hypothetical protein
MNEQRLILLLQVSRDIGAIFDWDDDLDWLEAYGYIGRGPMNLPYMKNKGEDAISLAIVSINARFED